MQSTLNPKPSDDPHDVLVVAPDVVLVAPTDAELSKLAHAMRHASGPQTHTGSDSGPKVPPVAPVDATFRATAVNNVRVRRSRSSIGGRVIRGFIGFVLTVGIGVAAVVWQAYGDATKQMIAEWAPQFALTSSPAENPGLPEQPNPPAVQASAAKAVPPAQTAAEGVAPAAAAASPAEPPSLQSMARDLAAAGQEIEQLKASIEQLKASQEQMSRDVAKASEVKASESKPPEQNLRPRVSALPPRPAAAPARRPMPPPFRPSQAATAPMLPPAAAPSVPRQVEPIPPPAAPPPLDPELSSVPRPPLPLSQ